MRKALVLTAALVFAALVSPAHAGSDSADVPKPPVVSKPDLSAPYINYTTDEEGRVNIEAEIPAECAVPAIVDGVTVGYAKSAPFVRPLLAWFGHEMPEPAEKLPDLGLTLRVFGACYEDAYHRGTLTQ